MWRRLVEAEGTRQGMPRLIVEGDGGQWADKRFRHELAERVHPRGAERADGLPGSAQAKGSIRQMTSPFVVRTFDLWREEAARNRQFTAGAPVLAVLGALLDTRADWFNR